MGKKFHSYREASKTNWGTHLDEGQTVDREQIHLGAMLRIADATEIMAKRHQELIADLERANSSRDYWRSVCKSNDATIRTLRGHITRLKKQLAKQQS